MKLGEIVRQVNIDSRKLTEYVLNPEAPWGRHKAFVFARVLGFTLENYADLLSQIEEHVLEGEAVLHSEDVFGQRYTVDLPVTGTEERQGIVRTGWLVSPGADKAWLLTLYVRR